MAMNPNDPFSLEGLGLGNDNLPPELGSEMLRNLDQILARQEGRQATQLLDSQEERGLFRSGQSEDRLQHEILQPGIETRRQALLGLVGKGADQKREERMGGVQFEREKEFANLQMDLRIRELEQLLSNNKELLRLQDEIADGNEPSFWDQMGDAFASGFGGSSGKAFGEAGGKAAGRSVFGKGGGR